MSADNLTIERDDSIAILTFNRPEVLNAFNNSLMKQTLEEVAKLNADDTVRAIVVRGAGRGEALRRPALELGGVDARLAAAQLLRRHGGATAGQGGLGRAS